MVLPYPSVIHYPPLHNAAEPGMGHASSPALPAESSGRTAAGEIHKSVQLSCGEHTDYGVPLPSHICDSVENLLSRI